MTERIEMPEKNFTSQLPQFLERNEAELLKEWLKSQAPGRPPALPPPRRAIFSRRGGSLSSA